LGWIAFRAGLVGGGRQSRDHALYVDLPPLDALRLHLPHIERVDANLLITHDILNSS